MVIDAIVASGTTPNTLTLGAYDPLTAYAANKAYAATQPAEANLTAAPALPSGPTRSFAPGPASDDAAGPTVPQGSDYNAQAALGLAFASAAVVTSLAPGAAAMAAMASLPAVGPVEYLAPIARNSIFADPHFIDVYR